jgi:hypothetical protein
MVCLVGGYSVTSDILEGASACRGVVRNHRLPKFLFSIAVAAVLVAHPAFAQDVSEGGDRQAQQVLRVFLDCTVCDFNNIRQEISYINYVRDRRDADVHVLVTTQRTGSGGQEYRFEFIGLGAFEPRSQKLTLNTGPTDTEDERRQDIVRTFSLGLTPFLLQTPAADQFSLQHDPPTETTTAALPQDDPWNFWIFRVGGSVNVNGEERQQSRRFNGNTSANRTTEDWKLSFSTTGSFNESEFTLSDGNTVLSTTKNYNVNGIVVRSLGDDHWGGLVHTAMSSNTRTNNDLSVRLAGGIEYNFFSYAESTRRSFVIQYSIGTTHFDYAEVTLFGKLSERLADERFAAIVAFRQPWGTSRLTTSFTHYLHDVSKHRVEVNGRVDVRLFRGFGLNVSGNVNRIRNQLYLPAGEATDEEILLRQRQLGTNYRYGFQVGFSYQFGSIYNNIVNPRWF